jgi:hypothetical protein
VGWPGHPLGCAVLFALDLDYQPDPREKVFAFGPPRAATFRFRPPAYVSRAAEVFRVDAEGTTNVEYVMREGMLVISDRASRIAIYVAATRAGERERLEARRNALLRYEQAFGFDPAGNVADLAVLSALASSSRR